MTWIGILATLWNHQIIGESLAAAHHINWGWPGTFFAHFAVWGHLIFKASSLQAIEADQDRSRNISNCRAFLKFLHCHVASKQRAVVINSPAFSYHYMNRKAEQQHCSTKLLVCEASRDFVPPCVRSNVSRLVEALGPAHVNTHRNPRYKLNFRSARAMPTLIPWNWMIFYFQFSHFSVTFGVGAQKITSVLA